MKKFEVFKEDFYPVYVLGNKPGGFSGYFVVLTEEEIVAFEEGMKSFNKVQKMIDDKMQYEQI